MALKGALKKPTLPQIEEEKDAFLSFINKRLRNNNKKLKEIQELEARENLKAEQKAKIQSKPQILENSKYYEGIKDLYYQSLKVVEEEGGEYIKPPAPKSIRKVSFEDQVRSGKKSPDLKKPDTEKQHDHHPEEKTQASEEMIKPVPAPLDVREILNLTHFVPFFMDNVIREEFDHEFENMRESLDLGEYPDFDAIFDFHKKVFTFAEGSRYETIEMKIANSLTELELYLRRDQQLAIRERSYEYLHEIVKKLTASAFFKNKQSDIQHEEAPQSMVLAATKKIQPVENTYKATTVHMPQDGIMSEAFLKSVLEINKEDPNKNVHLPRDRRPDAEANEKHHYPKEKYPHPQKTEEDHKEGEPERTTLPRFQKPAQEPEFIPVEAKYRKKKEAAQQETKNEKSGPKKYKNDRYKNQKPHQGKQYDATDAHTEKETHKEPLKERTEEHGHKGETHGKQNEPREHQKGHKSEETGEYHKGSGQKESYGSNKRGAEQEGEGYGYKKGYRNQKSYENKGFEGRRGQKGGYQVVYAPKKEEGEAAQ